jgi:tetratricopeptide (TPR) repeat protein/tRNA A-37 threonylcarbamoyl transferase component Bud32
LTGAYEPSASQVAAGTSPVRTEAYYPEAPPPYSQRYVGLRFHARGGMGEVWIAEDRALGRSVALKRLRKKRAEQRERFMAEAQITGQLEHPGVVPVHDLGADEEGQPFYIMPFVQGRTLQAAIAEYHAGDAPGGTPREVQRRRLLQVFVRVCETVAYAHSRGVIHRDLKPDNIMLGPYGEALLLDWGLAKVLGQPDRPGEMSSAVHLAYSPGGSSHTEDGAVIGAPPYMAPEVAEGRGTQADARTDVYLLGATLYEVLTGRPPRQGHSRSEIIEQARTVPPVPPRSVNRAVPRALEAICLKAMARRMEDRYATALALAEDVQRYLAGEVVSAYREGLPARAWRWAKRHRRLLAGTALAAVVLGVLLGSVAWVRDAEGRRRQAQSEAEELRRHDKARAEAEQFRGLVDDMTFYAASTNPVAERTPYYNPGAAEDVGREADALALGWGRTLENLALTGDERGPVAEDVYDFLLLRAQLKAAAAPAGDRDAARQARALLERARDLQAPSRGYYRLSAICSRLLGEDEQAAREQQRADDPATRATGLDHFLLGERERARAAGSVGPAPDPESAAALHQAIEEYTAAGRDPRRAYWAHFQIGRCYLALGEGDRALQALAACTALRPHVPWAHSVQGLALALQRRYADAERELQMTLDEHPDFVPARLNLGAAYWLRRQYEPALEQFERVLRLPPEKCPVEARFFRARVLLERGDPARRDVDRALEDLTQVIQEKAKEKAEFRPAYLARAQAHFARGETDLGLDDLNVVVRAGRPQFDPGDAAAHEQRGRLLRRLVVPQLPANQRGAARAVAVRQLQKAEELGSRSAALFDDLGAVLEGSGQLSAAIRAYTRGLELAPEHARLRNKRGWALLGGKPPQPDRAREDFTVAARLEPGTAADRLALADAHIGLGYIHACAGKTPEAVHEATRALLALRGTEGDAIRHVDHYVLRHNLACIYGELSRSDAKHRAEHEELAMEFLREAVTQAQRTGAGAEEADSIDGESAFPRSLRERPDFRVLQKSARR